MEQSFVDLLDRNREHAETFQTRFDSLQDGQQPELVTVCCSDSRVLQDEMWGNDEPGKIFTCGNIGNRVIQHTDDGAEVVSGDVLYPVVHTDTKTVVVVGHTGCGAVTGTYDELTTGLDEPDGIEHCLGLLSPHLRAGIELLPDGVGRTEAINKLVEYNVDRQLDALAASDDVPDDVRLVGCVYDFQDIYSGHRGEVHVINVDGERDVETLRAEHPEIGTHIERFWEY